MLKNYIKVAFRNLFSNKLFTTVNILGLGIGLSTALLIFVWVQNEWSFDKYHEESNQIYRVISHIDVGEEIWNWASIPHASLSHIEQLPEVAQVALLQTKEVLFKIDQRKVFEEKNFALVNKDWFEVFDYEILAGNIEDFTANIYSIALTQRQAKKYFGTTEVIGENIAMDSILYQVNLVLADPPPNSSFTFDAYIPMESTWTDKETLQKKLTHWGNYDYDAYIKMVNANIEPDFVVDKMIAIFNEHKKDENYAFSLEQLADIRFSQTVDDDDLQHQNKAGVYIFTLIGFIILLVAGLNYINLSSALMSQRVREIGIKKVIGASFKHVFFQVLCETALITLIGSGLALCIVGLCLPVLSTFVELPLEFAWTNYFFWLGFLGLLTISTLIAGVYPAMLFGGFKPIQLFQVQKATVKGISLRKVLVVSQFVAAIVTIICTLVIYQQLLLLQTADLGYDKEYVIEFSPNLFAGDWQENYKKFHLFERELQTIPAFEAVAPITGSSMLNVQGEYGSDNYHWEGKDTTSEIGVAGFNANEKLLDIFDLEMVAGRWFSDKLETDENAIIFNETAVRLLKIDDPIGKKIQAHGGEVTIIGVVKDYHYMSPKESIQPLRIMYTNRWTSTILGKVNAQSIPQALASAEQKFKAIYPDIPFQYSFLDETYQKLHESEAKLSFLFRVFAGVLLFISCLGLFGLATFAVERRTKEIGIRKVLGASVDHIIQLLSKDFIQLIGIALLISSPIAWYLMQAWLENYAMRVSLSWQSFMMVGVAVIGIALLTVSIQSVRAALTNPVNSLRNE